METTSDFWQNAFTQISTLLSTIVGACLVWFFARRSEKDKIIHEDKKQLKKVLFYLLEIRIRLIESQRYDEFVNFYVEWVRERLPIDAEIMPKEAWESLAKPFEAIKERVIGIKFNDESDKLLSQQFNQTVHSLAEVDPLLAYRLSDKQNLKGYIESLSKGEIFTDTAYSELEDDYNEVEKSKALKHIETKFMKEATGEIDSIIIDVAKSVDFKTLQQVQDKLSPIDSSARRLELHQTFEKYFDGVGNHITES
ncbi:hypothetical protein [Pontibacter pudoricolor]|uniref:hypothetical protein n=1 Tax=Pontibacter pudoricolor TaxID=2694930 RepID=UPI0013909D4A|nr:hypothetical protein [Pontibacter pudoricolor]